ncbi:MAG: PLP-dependent transferase, partial [Anaerolineales bacterium]|nr:PLP-dependent transferase [Anaerolineales bacterium]
MTDSHHLATHLIHAGDAANPTTAVSAPIYQSATFRFDSPEAIAAAMTSAAHPLFYGRYATPNTKQVEATVAKLEGGEAALAVASGMAAISLVILGHLHAGDHLVAQQSLYPTTYRFFHEML